MGGWKLERLELYEGKCGRVLFDCIEAIWRHVREPLCLAGHWPEDFDEVDFMCIPQSDFLPQGIASKAPTRGDGPMNLPLALRRGYLDLNARTDGSPIGYGSFQFKRDPVVAVPWILIEDAIGLIS